MPFGRGRAVAGKGRAFRLPDLEAASALQKKLTGGALPGPVPVAVPAVPAKVSAKVSWSDELAKQMVAANLPPPVPEYKFHPTRRWRLDLAYPGTLFGIEVDGAVHRIKSRFKADLEKHQAWFGMGWRVLRVTPQQVRDGAALELVTCALRSAG